MNCVRKEQKKWAEKLLVWLQEGGAPELHVRGDTQLTLWKTGQTICEQYKNVQQCFQIKDDVIMGSG